MSGGVLPEETAAGGEGQRVSSEAEKRGCYCGIWEKHPAFFESRGVPRGFCGFCQRCNNPGHTRHFPGAVPYTGCWCDFHYRLISLIHPFGSLGVILYFGVTALVLWLIWALPET